MKVASAETFTCLRMLPSMYRNSQGYGSFHYMVNFQERETVELEELSEEVLESSCAPNDVIININENKPGKYRFFPFLNKPTTTTTCFNKAHYELRLNSGACSPWI